MVNTSDRQEWEGWTWTDLAAGGLEGEADGVALREEVRDPPQLDKQVVVRDVALFGREDGCSIDRRGGRMGLNGPQCIPMSART